MDQVPVATEPAEPPKPAVVPPSSARLSSRKLRAAELGLVLLVAFGPSVFTSLAFFLPAVFSPGPGPVGRDYSRLLPLTAKELLATDLRHLGALAVCAYVLLRRGLSFRALGLTWKESDLTWGAALGIANFLAHHGVRVALQDHGFGSAFPRGLNHYAFGFGTAGGPWQHVALSLYFGWHTLVVGLFEELLVRAFLMREVTFLTGSVPCAVLASVALQTSYHLYQGWASALCAAASFLVLSLFYAKTWRATPVVLSHALYDLVIALRQTWG